MLPQVFLTFLLSLGGIIAVDLILSGDNALIIGSAVVSIPTRWRTIALIVGGMGAIVLRIVCTAFATVLLEVNYVQTVGGLLVLYVTWNLLVEPVEQAETGETSADTTKKGSSIGVFFALLTSPLRNAWHYLTGNLRPEQGRFIMAALTIVITDISTSLDNIIAIAALARGQLVILSIGLGISIIILLIGSALVALLLERIPNLILLSSIVLAWIAGNLILQDAKKWLPLINQTEPFSDVIVYTSAFAIAGLAIYIRLKRNKGRKNSQDLDATKIPHGADNDYREITIGK